MTKIEINKNKFEILNYDKGEYQIEEDVKQGEDFVTFNYFGQIVHLYGSEITKIYEYLIKNRGK